MRDFSLKITKFSRHGGFIFGVSDFLLILRAEYVAVVHPIQNTNATLQSKNNIHMKTKYHIINGLASGYHKSERRITPPIRFVGISWNALFFLRPALS